MLTTITPKSSTVKLMKEILLRTSLKELGNLNKDLAELHEKVDGLSAERLVVIRKNLKGGVDDSTKDELVNAIDIEKLELNEQINKLEQQQILNEASIEYALNFMVDIAKQWSDASLELKQKMQELIFPNGFIYDIKNDNFIMNEISPLYRGISAIKQTDDAENSVMVISPGICI